MKRLENMQRYKMRWSAIVMSRKTIIRKAFRNIYYNSWSRILNFINQMVFPVVDDDNIK